MSFRPFLIPAFCALAALAACDGDSSVRIESSHSEDTDARGVLKVIDTLQCPQTQGSLTRKGSASAGGTVCTYVGPKGAEVSLHLVPLNGQTPATVLKTFEQRLSGDLPRAVQQLQSAEAEARKAAIDARAAGEAARTAAETAQEAAQEAAADAERASVRAPGVAIDTRGDDASVRLPGMRIETRGDRASVSIGGFHIDASDGDGSVNIESSGGGDNVSVQAHQDSAEVRASAAGDATRASWLLTDNRASESGWRLVGYEARGPVGGPLVVATVRSKDHNRGRVMEDARDLVALNVGE
jgi:hypothetical protein